MLGAALFFASTAILAWRSFARLSPGARLAAASLTALGAPILALTLAARLGLSATVPIVIGTHALLWLAAARPWAPRPAAAPSAGAGSPVPPAAGGLADAWLLAAAVAVSSALLGRDPSADRLVDPWAHLAWSRDLAASLHAYVPGFPALIASLSWPDPLLGAFRLSSVVLHFTLAAQFVALGARPRPAVLPAVAALAYLLTPASGRFDPPRPEVLGATLVAAAWWVLLEPGLAPRPRIAALGMLGFLTPLAHASPLEAVHAVALGLALALGAAGGGAGRRVAAIGALALGAALALVASPWLSDLAFAPARVPLLAAQPAMLGTLPWRSVIAGLGVSLVCLSGIGIAAWVAGVAGRTAVERVTLGCLALAAAALLAPLPLAALGLHDGLPLFTDRALIAAALMLALFAARALASGPGPGGLGWSVLALTFFALGQAARPLAPQGRALGAAVTGAGLAAAWLWGAPRLRAALVVPLLACAIGVRLWIWSPRVPAVAEWLAGQPASIPVVTQWPVTNELDALLEVPVIDGLAGRDANRGLHRVRAGLGLHPSPAWCGAGDDVARVADDLRGRGIRQAFLVVDDRFAEAWRIYREQREAALAAGALGRYPLLGAAPCAEPDSVRLATLRAALRAAPDAAPAFEAPGVTVFRLRVR